MADQAALRGASQPHPPGHQIATATSDESHIDWYGGCRCWCALCLTTDGAGNHVCSCLECNRRCGLKHVRPSEADQH